jgi:hypothetical protein
MSSLFLTITGRVAAVLGVLLGLSLSGRAQTFPLSAYTFTASQGTFTTIAAQGLGSVRIRDIEQDENDSRIYPITFPFVCGGTYTHFSVTSNGVLHFGTAAGIAGPDLSPFSDAELNGDTGEASYTYFGTAPNRTFIMEWRNWRWPRYLGSVNPPGTPSISFQIKLYESTNVVQYVYRREAAVPAPLTNLGAFIGLTDGSTSFLSLGDASAAPVASSTVRTSSITQRPVSGQVYTFTPPTPCSAPAGLAATATSPTTATVSFTPGAGTAGTVLVYGSTTAGTAPQTMTATASPVLLTGLLPNTTYNISIYSICGPNYFSASSAGLYFLTPPVPNTTATWTGAVSRDWTTAGNWNPATVPTPTTDVTIGPATRAPLLSGSVRVGRLTLDSGAALEQAAGSTLALNGDWLNNGATLTLDAGSTVLLDGDGAVTLGGTAPTAFQNLTVGNQTVYTDLAVAAAVQVHRLLRTEYGAAVTVPLTGGSLRLRAGGQVVRDPNAFVTGPVTVERAVPAGRTLYAPPVRSATVGGLAASPGYAPVVNPAYNTSSAPGAVLPQPTVFGYDQSLISTNTTALADFEAGFYSPDALADALVPGLGLRLEAPGPATLTLTGLLTVNAVNRTLLTRGTLPQSGYHLLGNPYAGVLDWNTVTAATTGLDAAVYTYEPAGAGTGRYRPYVNGVGGPRYLLPGQGFLVRVSSARVPANVSFTQAMRYGDYYDPASPPAAPAETRPLVQFTLATPSGPADEATVYFQAGATAGYDAGYDAARLPTAGGPALAWADAQVLAISGRPALTAADLTLPLSVALPAAGVGTLTATRLLNLPAGTYAYLLDAQAGTTTDLAQQPTYAFTQVGTAASARFSLRLTRTQVLATTPPALAAQVTLYPNPAHGTATLEVTAGLLRHPVGVTVRNALGQAVRALTVPPSPTGALVPLNVAGLPAGLYLVQVATSAGAVTKRLLVH